MNNNRIRGFQPRQRGYSAITSVDTKDATVKVRKPSADRVSAVFYPDASDGNQAPARRVNGSGKKD